MTADRSYPDLADTAFTSGAPGQLRNMESGMCLQLPSYNQYVNITLTQTPCDPNITNPSTNLKWSAVAQPSGGYAIKSGLGDAYAGFNKPNCASEGPANGDTVVSRDPSACATWQISSVVPIGGTPVQLTLSSNNDGTGRSSYVLDSNNPSGA